LTGAKMMIGLSGQNRTLDQYHQKSSETEINQSMLKPLTTQPQILSIDDGDCSKKGKPDSKDKRKRQKPRKESRKEPTEVPFIDTLNVEAVAPTSRYDLSFGALAYSRPSQQESPLPNVSGRYLGFVSLSHLNRMIHFGIEKKNPTEDELFVAIKDGLKDNKDVEKSHLRHLYRNFADFPIRDSKKKNLPLSPREYEILLYGYHEKCQESCCKLLIPYRKLAWFKGCLKGTIFDRATYNEQIKASIAKLISLENENVFDEQNHKDEIPSAKTQEHGGVPPISLQTLREFIRQTRDDHTQLEDNFDINFPEFAELKESSFQTFMASRLFENFVDCQDEWFEEQNHNGHKLLFHQGVIILSPTEQNIARRCRQTSSTAEECHQQMPYRSLEECHQLLEEISFEVVDCGLGQLSELAMQHGSR